MLAEGLRVLESAFAACHVRTDGARLCGGSPAVFDPGTRGSYHRQLCPKLAGLPASSPEPWHPPDPPVQAPRNPQGGLPRAKRGMGQAERG